MAKVQSFSDKVAKAQQTSKVECPQCGGVITYVKVVAPVLTEKGSYRFRPKVEKVCKCENSNLLAG
jgi:hypothetical protein